MPYYRGEFFADEHDIPDSLVGDANHVDAIISAVVVDNILFDPSSRGVYGGQWIKLLDDSLVLELGMSDILVRDGHLNRGMVIAPVLELVELFEHGCTDEYEADVAFDHVVDVEQAGVSE